MRIPEREVALRQLAEAELPPRQELHRQVAVNRADDLGARREKHVVEHRQNEHRQAGDAEAQMESVFHLSRLRRKAASMSSMPPTISVAAGMVWRMTTRGSSAPNPASPHSQSAAALQAKPHRSSSSPAASPRSSVTAPRKRSRPRWRGRRPALCAKTRAKRPNRQS